MRKLILVFLVCLLSCEAKEAKQIETRFCREVIADFAQKKMSESFQTRPWGYDYLTALSFDENGEATYIDREGKRGQPIGQFSIEAKNGFLKIDGKDLVFDSLVCEIYSDMRPPQEDLTFYLEHKFIFRLSRRENSAKADECLRFDFKQGKVLDCIL